MLARRLGLAIAAGLVALAGLAFLLVAADYWLELNFPPWLAAAIVGAVLVVIAAILLWAGLHRAPVRQLTPEDLALAALSLVARSVRMAPEKALIAALIAGVVSEWLKKDRKREKR